MENNSQTGHTGHRERMKNRFKEKMSLDTFSDREILEMLLYYVIPRKDTRQISEKLIQKFGSLKNVLSGDINELAESGIISGNCGISLKFFDSLAKKINGESGDFHSNTDLRDFPKMYGFVINLFDSRNEKSALKILSVNENLTIKSCEDIGIINGKSYDFLGKECAKAVLKNGCNLAVTVNNHPGEKRKPLEKDIILARKIMVFLRSLDITLLDHYIAGKDGAVSLRQQGLIYDLDEC